ncbi:MAG: hypothetical protein ACT4OO_01840 [Nitrospiraceae bacterium]
MRSPEVADHGLERREVTDSLLLLLIGLMLSVWACVPYGSPRIIVGEAGEYEVGQAKSFPESCHTSTELHVSAAKPTVTVSYQEPTTNSDGTTLQDLAYTTIYFGPPAGPVHMIQVWASDVAGGGQVTIQNLSVPVQPNQQTWLRICVTATDWSKNEGTTQPAQNATR